MRRHLVSFLVLPAALLGIAAAAAQEPPRPPRDIDDLLSPRPPVAPPPRPGGVQTAPLPPPGSAPPSAPEPGARSVPDIAAPPLRKGQQPQKGRPPPQPSEVTVVQPAEQRIANPTATFSGLDKITGRIITFDVAINETVQFGALQVTPRACYTRPPTEIQNTTGFIEVEEITLEGKVRRLFTGWMFAASPGLHAVEHAIYDVWLIDCKQAPPVIDKPRS
jgi:hypothetical protein